MLDIIWGLKTKAMLDIWTIEHILSGMSVGFFAKNNNDKIFNKKFDIKTNYKYFDIIFVLFIAYLWETIEHYLETGLAGEAVEYWFQGVEFWANRIIFDPLALIIGYLIVRKYNNIVHYARILSVIWLIVHIFIFDHSMQLHYMF
jgi:hypothetical protein